MRRKRGRVRRLTGWFGRRRFARYSALRQVWHKHYGYSAGSFWRKPSNAYIEAAEYAWQLGAAAFSRQLHSVKMQKSTGWFTHRSKVDYEKVMRAVGKRADAEHRRVPA